MNNYQYNASIIWKSFCIILIIQIIPYLTNLFYLSQPSWLSLLLIYWLTKTPNHINIGSGFTIGLITDILSGPIIGVRAMTLSTIIYLLITKLPIFSNLPIWQQTLIIILFSFSTHLIVHLIYIISIDRIKFYPKMFLNNVLNNILFNSIMDGIVWIGIVLIMSKINTNEKIRNKH